METILKGMLGKLGGEGVQQIGQVVELDQETTAKILKQVAPLLLAKMADNSEKPEGLDSLDKALGGHDGSIFGKLGDLVNPNVDTKGSKILGHIFGSKKEAAIEAVAKENNVSSGVMGKLFEMAGPLVLGQLGAQKKQSGFDASSIFDLLQGEKKQASEGSDSMYMKLAKTFLDKDGDGSIVDDVLGMAAGKLFGGKS